MAEADQVPLWLSDVNLYEVHATGDKHRIPQVYSNSWDLLTSSAFTLRPVRYRSALAIQFFNLFSGD